MSKNIKRLFSISFALFLIMNYYAFIKGDAFNIKQAFNELYVYEENQYNFDDYYLEFNNISIFSFILFQLCFKLS